MAAILDEIEGLTTRRLANGWSKHWYGLIDKERIANESSKARTTDRRRNVAADQMRTLLARWRLTIVTSAVRSWLPICLRISKNVLRISRSSPVPSTSYV